MANLLGVVLSGGQSKRMGRDKGLIPISETTWARHIAAKLEELQLPFVVSVNPGQVEAYATIFPSGKLVVDNIAAVEGPLQGLLSVFQRYPHHDLLLLACDMVDMDLTTLATLVAAWQKEPAHAFYAYQSDAYLEPFGAIYTAAGLKAVAAEAASGTMKNFGLMRILKAGNTRVLPLTDSTGFKNYNSL